MAVNVNYKEWLTQKKLSIAYQTIEVYHESLGTLRYVRNQQFDKSFTLPSDAPRNPSESVVFEPVGFAVQRPEQGDQPVVQMSVQLGAVGTDIKQLLKQIPKGGFMDSAELIYRVFLDGAQVQYLPLQISTITITTDNVVINAEQSNPTFRNISRRYTYADFPGLLLL